VLVMTERPSIADELKNLNSLICAMNITPMAKHEMLMSVRNIHCELDKKTEAARNWERIANTLDSKAKEIVANLRKYGRHLPECGESVCGEDCACGFYTAYNGKQRGKYEHPFHHKQCPCTECANGA